MSRKKKASTGPKLTIAESLGLSSKPQPPLLSFGSMRFDNSPISEQIVRNLILSLGEGGKDTPSTPTGKEIPEGNISPKRMRIPKKPLMSAVEGSDTTDAIPRSMSYKDDGPSHDRGAPPMINGTPLISSRLIHLQQNKFLVNNASNPVSSTPSSQANNILEPALAIDAPSRNISRVNEIEPKHNYYSLVGNSSTSTLKVEGQTSQSIPSINKLFTSEGSDVTSAFAMQNNTSTIDVQNRSDSDMEVDECFPDIEPVTPVGTNMDLDGIQDDLPITQTVDHGQGSGMDPNVRDVNAVTHLNAEISNPINKLHEKLLNYQDTITEPGIWRAIRGLSRPGFKVMTFDVPVDLAEAARKWSGAYEIFEPNATPISVRLSCVTNTSISHLEDQVSNNISQNFLAKSVRDIPNIWPANFDFGIEIIRGEELSDDNWTAITLPTLAESLDITSFISSGKTTLRFSHAIALDEFTFVLSALHPTAEERQEMNDKAIRERDIQIFMDKLQAITIPRGSSFKFPVCAS